MPWMSLCLLTVAILVSLVGLSIIIIMEQERDTPLTKTNWWYRIGLLTQASLLVTLAFLPVILYISLS